MFPLKKCLTDAFIFSLQLIFYFNAITRNYTDALASIHSPLIVSASSNMDKLYYYQCYLYDSWTQCVACL